MSLINTNHKRAVSNYEFILKLENMYFPQEKFRYIVNDVSFNWWLVELEDYLRVNHNFALTQLIYFWNTT